VAGGFARLVLDAEVDAWAGEAQGVGVVAALRDDGADERGERVPGDVEPVGPRGPVAVVAGDGLADVEDDGLNHLAKPTMLACPPTLLPLLSCALLRP
jgi:hypothetical protein